MQEEAIQQPRNSDSSENQDKARLSPKNAPGGDAVMRRDVRGNLWQALQEISHADEDLASIFQGDFELGDSADGLNDWMVFTEQTGLPSVERHQDKSPAQVSLDEIVSPVTCDAYAVSTITFYLVPRQNDAFVLGEFAHRLRGWLVEICQHYAWQLDFISVRPKHMRWTLCDFPHLLVQDMLQIVRHETSQRIFKNFSHLQLGIGVTDFWAPGYLLDLGNRDFSTQALMTYLAKGSFRVLKPA